MPIRSQENVISAWAFLVGVVLAVIAGFVGEIQPSSIILLLLIALGLIIGYFVSEKDVQTFLFASAALVLASFAGIQGLAADVSLRGVAISGVEIIKTSVSILSSLLLLFVPATIIVALKTVFSLAKR